MKGTEMTSGAKKGASVDLVTGEAIKNAIETRNGSALASFYAKHAVARVIDRNNPPSRPKEIKGKDAIETFWADICGREMTHSVTVSATQDNRIAFTEACAYPDGTKVFCMAVVELEDG